MDKNILLLKEQDKYDIEVNPSGTKDIVKGFKLYEFGDENLKDCILRVGSKDIPLDEYKDNSLYIVESELYNKNIYYPLDKYSEYYETDFYKIISSMAFNMGASHVKIYAKNEESNINRKEGETKFENKMDVNLKGINIEANADINVGYNNNSHYSVDKSEKIMYEDKNENTKITKEEFSDWIEKEDINEKALTFFEDRINHFKKTGEADGELNLKWEKSEHSKSIYETYKEIETNISLLHPRLSSVKQSFNFISRKVENNEKKLSKELFIHIKF